MKKYTLLLVGLALGASQLSAQDEFQRDTISMNQNYQTSVYYSLDDQSKTHLDNFSWDLAFRTTPMTVGVYANHATKNWEVTQVFVENSTSTITAEEKFLSDLTADYNALFQSVDLEDYQFYNSVTTWDTGALNMWSPEDPQINFNLGWGMYDMSSHKIVGHKVFVLSVAPAWPGAPVDPNSPKYKVYIKEHNPVSAERKWEFWYAPIDATNESDIIKIEFNGEDYGDKLLVYFNFETQSFSNEEPEVNNWDFVFTRYKDLVTAGPQTMWYGVTGVLLNNRSEAFGALNPLPDGQEFDPNNDDVYDFIEWDLDIPLINNDISIIGRNWRGSNSNNEYDIVPNAYFVKSKDNKIYHVRFRRAALGSSAPEGLQAGDIVFEYQMVEDLVNIQDWKKEFNLSVYPNPTENQITLNIDNRGSNQTGTIVITDMTGRHLLQSNAEIIAGNSQFSLDMSAFATGMYLVHIQLEQGLISKKIIKK